MKSYNSKNTNNAMYLKKMDKRISKINTIIYPHNCLDPYNTVILIIN